MPAKPPHAPDDEPLDPLTEEALGWLVRLHSGAETPQDWSDYEDWKAGRPEHRQAALRAEALWEKLGPTMARGKSRIGRLPVLVLAVVGLAATAFGSGLFGPPRAYFADQRTAVGEQRSVTLADGSQLDLDTGTSVDVDLTGGERNLRLYSGQIFVSVRPDPTRPFVVRTGQGAVRALGTAFVVRRDHDATTVIVTESKVRVTFPDDGQGRSVDVAEGQETAFAPQTGLAPARPADLRRGTAWRSGQMVFDQRRLGDVVTEMGRYRWGKVIITDAAVSDIAVTGVFDTRDPDALLDAVALAFPVTVTRLPLLTLIRPDPARGGG